MARTRPGLAEVVVGIVVFAIVGYGLPVLLNRTGLADEVDTTVFGLFLTALSGVAGLAGFVAADRIRIRHPAAFGLRRTTGRWLLIGVACGILALVLARLAAAAVFYLSSPGEDVQASYREAAGDGVLTVVLSLLFLAVLTPIGEEFLFRGVVATALLRFGAVTGVVGSALSLFQADLAAQGR
uniref:CPBP family glutamic-type intramembrane protease n=1 Tax=Paractinoplanes polyasparticus TaxID=2856853 RepID=UPI001C865A06|nr:CPBP family glutamic-type intramembrane protease [Actinoplanes polyasparticus]